MSDERALWDWLRNGMRGRWHAQRHEDRLSAGVPDVSYACGGADGWIELKRIRAFPVLPKTPVRTNLTIQQALWLEARGRAGAGRCFVLVRSPRGVHLFRWSVARCLAAGIDHEGFMNISVASYGSTMDWDDFTRRITQ